MKRTNGYAVGIYVINVNGRMELKMDSEIKLIHGDCLDILPTLPEKSIDAIICDPPYGLRFMSKHWDYDVPTVAQWSECLRVLKPGGHLLSFGGSRTYHRMAVNVEDAGFEIRDQIMWLYGSGFPKSMDIGKQLDKMAGAEREVIGTVERWGANASGGRGSQNGNSYQASKVGAKKFDDITAPASPAAKQWDGWGTALKPAHEPIVLARKPTDGATMARNNAPGANGWKNSSGGKNSAALNGEPSGRWPANVVHDGSDEVLAGFPLTTSKQNLVSDNRSQVNGSVALNDTRSLGRHDPLNSYGDTGSAARFFYCAKASRSERTCNGKVDNSHPTVKPLELMRYLCRLITPPDGLVLDPFMGSGSTGVAALECGRNFIGIELDEHYYQVACERIEATWRRLQGLARKATDTFEDLPLLSGVDHA